jgi:hypothetical protein
LARGEGAPDALDLIEFPPGLDEGPLYGVYACVFELFDVCLGYAKALQ